MTNNAEAGRGRRWLAEHRRLWLVVWAGGVLAGAAALLFALEGVWVAAAGAVAATGALFGLAGEWVLPRSRDAYWRRVRRTWEDWANHAQWAYRRVALGRDRQRDRLRALAPPEGFRAEHDRLVEVVDAGDDQATDDPLPERTRVAVTGWRSIVDTHAGLAVRARTDEEREYVVALGRLLDERRARYVAATRQAERATEEALARLGRARPPDGLAEEHNDLMRAFDRYLAVATEFHAACREADADGAVAAAQAWDVAIVDIQERAADIAEQLGNARRTPENETAALDDN